MAGFTLSLLGSPTVRDANGAVVRALAGSKTLALLAFLALEPGPHTREALATLLWGDVPDDAARASLRQTLHQLRLGLGEGIRLGRQTVELTDALEGDVLDFLRLVDDDPRAAVAVEVPRFLQGFTARHAPAFEDWAAAKRQALVRRYEGALARLAREAMSAWRWREAAEWAERWLECDPLSDEAIRLRIETLYLAGDRGAALGRFAEYRARLRREVGCEPGKALLALLQRIEQDAVRPGSAYQVSGEWSTRAPTFEATLVGRTAQWQQLTETWTAAARHGESRVVLVEGEAGVGKSRLAGEFARWVVAAGGTVLRGHAYEAHGGVPYGPVVEALREALDAPGLAGTAPEWLAEVARLVPELRQRFPALAEQAAREALAAREPGEGWKLFEGVAQVLLALAAERPVLVLLEDLQWADAESCALLHHLARRVERAPVLWLATLTLGALERDAPVARLGRSWRARPHALSLALPPLDAEQVWQLVRETGHVSTPTGARRFANRIHEVTGGNPFYVVELLKTLLAQGLLVVDEGSAEWTVAPGFAADGVAELPMPRSVHDAIGDRVERLPEELREVLITVALAGAGCGTELLSHVHGISRLHAAAIGDALVERRLLVEEHGSYRCTHPVVARVTRAGLTTSRQREVHRALALALARVTPPDRLRSVAGEIARHAEWGDEPALAYTHAVMASEAAVARFAYEEALFWLDLAAATARPGPETDAVNRRTADVLETAGWPEAPARRSGPVAPEIEQADLDLKVHT